jgi:hypothetical protein
VSIEPGAGSADDSYEGLASSVYFNGVVDFENVFEGHLPAAEYPKIPFYFSMGVVYLLLGIGWGVLCWRNRHEILGIQVRPAPSNLLRRQRLTRAQHYVSATIVFIVVEMFALWGYWSYLNASGTQRLSRPLLVLGGFRRWRSVRASDSAPTVSVLNAARNSISFFMLCIVCMGWGVVRPSLGSVMLRVRILAGFHFAFGVLYSIGTVTIPLESAGMFLFFCVMPLAFSLTAFMMWISASDLVAFD